VKINSFRYISQLIKTCELPLGLKHRSQVINTRGCKTGSSFKSEIKIHSAIEGG
jgi:hypothetical protein